MNRQRVRRFFKASKADAALLHNGDSTGALDPNYFYFTGMQLDNSILVARKRGPPALLCTALNYDYAKKAGVRVLRLERQTLPKVLKGLLKGCRKVGINSRSLRVSVHAKFRQAGKRFLDVSDELGENRAVKDGAELAIMKKCANETREILDALEIRPGRSELDILQELRVRALELGAEPSFPPIVASGPNTRIPHSIPTGRKIRGNEVVLVDFGLRMDGYCSDLTRCYFTGACREERRIYEKLENVHDSLADYCRAGLPVAEFVMESVELMKRQGLPAMPHAIGHGVGLEVHEQPYLYLKSKQKLQEGMVLAIEPSFYGRKFGLSYENDFVVGKGGAQVL